MKKSASNKFSTNQPHPNLDFTKIEREIIQITEEVKKFSKASFMMKMRKTILPEETGSKGKHFDGGGDYIKFIDSQLRLNSPGHPGFYGAEIDINDYNHKLALNKSLWDYESGHISDAQGFSEVWKDALGTLEFNDIDHWLHAGANIKDSFDVDSGFWSEADNISFITDYDLEFGENY